MGETVAQLNGSGSIVLRGARISPAVLCMANLSRVKPPGTHAKASGGNSNYFCPSWFVASWGQENIPQHSNRRRIMAPSTEQIIEPPYKSTRLRNGRHLPGHSMHGASCCSPGTRLWLAILMSTAELDWFHGRGKLCLWDTGTLTHCAAETLSGKNLGCQGMLD